MQRYPGAFWRPAGTYQGAMSRLDGMTFHEAVTRAQVPLTGRSNIAGWVDSANACHGFVDGDGAAEQFKDFDELAWGVKDGNHRLATWETWDNLSPKTELTPDGKGPNETEWTPQQSERIADIMAWGHVVLGVPLRLMTSSDPDQQGYAPHRLGINPWRTGSELWTKAQGKQCPGDLRVAQLPAILARAEQIADLVSRGIADWLPTGPVDLDTALARGTLVSPTTPTTPSTPEDDMALTDDDKQDIRQIVLDVIVNELGARAVNNPRSSLNAGFMARADLNFASRWGRGVRLNGKKF